MFTKLSAKRNKKGFTLAELLIVVAIIAVLVAIAIPVYSAQLDKAKEAVNLANARSAAYMASAEYLSNQETQTKTYYFSIDEQHNMAKVDSKPSAPYVEVKIAAGGKITSASYTSKDGGTTPVDPDETA